MLDYETVISLLHLLFMRIKLVFNTSRGLGSCYYSKCKQAANHNNEKLFRYKIRISIASVTGSVIALLAANGFDGHILKFIIKILQIIDELINSRGRFIAGKLNWLNIGC